MLVRAKHNIFRSGVFHRGGETFEVSTAEADELREFVDIAETPIHEEAKTAEPEAPKRGRKKKAAEPAE